MAKNGKKSMSPRYGGDAPDKHDVIKSANATADKGRTPDQGVLPASGGPSLDKAGIQDTGYINKKGLTDGVNEFYNTLPPGMNIEDQALADIHAQPIKYITDLGYPGDGWT